MKIPITLTSRLVLTTVGLVALVGILVSLTTTLAMRSYLVGQLDEDVRDSARRVVELTRPDEPAIPRIGLVAAFDETGQRTGTAIGGVGARAATALTDQQLDDVERVPADGELHTVDVPGLGSFRMVSQQIMYNGTPITIVSGLPMDEVTNPLTSLMWWEVWLTLGGIVLAFGGASFLVRRNLRPLREVAAVAQEVTNLPLDQGSVGETARVPERLTDERTEVGQVGASLNSLLNHVEQALDARHRSELQVRQFVADASHELRTPLTTIRGYAELAGREADVLPTSMTKVSEEAERMSALVDDLLLLARLDSGRPLASEPVDLSALIVGAVDDARVVDPSHTWALELPAEPVVVTGDEHRLHQVVTNLLNNARRHTPAGTTVTAGLEVSGGRVSLLVHDTGPGIPTDVNVFERFTRGDSSRTRASGGAGLGLSLVAAIAGAHEGEVSVRSKPGDTTFTVELPAEPS
jgi:two-component system, OmpR family, sensor kinase